jgi:hypothetical protein
VISTDGMCWRQAGLEMLKEIGEPCGTRTHDPLIKRRGPVDRRPSVFQRSSAQPCAAA